MDHHNLNRGSLSREWQWCGNAEGETEPLQDRLLEFARLDWRNKAYNNMMYSILCDSDFELCDEGHSVSTAYPTVVKNCPYV